MTPAPNTYVANTIRSASEVLQSYRASAACTATQKVPAYVGVAELSSTRFVCLRVSLAPHSMTDVSRDGAGSSIFAEHRLNQRS